MNNLKRIVIGNKCFKVWYYYYGRPENCFRVVDCPQLRSIEIGNRSFFKCGTCEFRNLPSLEEMRFGNGCFQWASLELRDLPRLKLLQFGEMCFCCCHSLVLENLPELESIRFDKGTFCFDILLQ
ncbi:hypothetical protein BLSTO_05745 [Blastocystis sp. subtype 1]